MTRILKNTKKPKRKSDEIKLQILEVLNNGKTYTFSKLSGELGTSYNTVISNCEFLKLLHLIEVNIINKENSASGKGQSNVKITKKGKIFLEETDR